MSYLNEEILQKENNFKNFNNKDNAKEIEDSLEETEKDYESLKLRMKRKVTDFFNLNKILTYEKFMNFMDYIDLSQIFSTDDIEVIWKTFSIIAEERETIEIDEAIKGVNELLSYFYSDGSENKTQENEIELNNQKIDNNKNSEIYIMQNNYEIKYDKENENRKSINNICFRNDSIEKIDNSLNLNNVNIDSDKNVESILMKTKLKNLSNKSINLNENFDKLEINITNKNYVRSRNNSVNLNPNQLYNLASNVSNSNINSSIKPKGPRHQRNITKIFKEIDIETLKQLKRVFSLLEIKNKEVLYIRELNDILKYKFIYLTFDQIFDFLLNLSYDLNDSNRFINKENINKQGKININFELYSRAISAIEQKILNENFDEFQEVLNDSYEVKESFGEVYENINQLDCESKDYISVLADIFISLRQKYESEFTDINSNLNLILNTIKNKNDDNYLINQFISNIAENIAITKNQISDYFKNCKDKYDDIEIFLKDLNKNNFQAYNKIGLLKIISEKYERNLKSLEEDYRILFEKYNTTQPFEVNDELEQLMDENLVLKDELENKYNTIESLHSEIRDKEDCIFNGKIEIEKMKKINSDIENNFNYYKRNYENVQKDYEKLRNEIYEKIIKEEEDELNNNENNFIKKNKNNNISENENEKKNYIRHSVFLKEKFLKEESENANKILEMSYEKLVLYCLDVEKANSKFISIFPEKEIKIKSLESEIENLRNLNDENTKKIYLLTSENARLSAKLNDILRENEFNKGFRPSIALNNRISRMSNVRGISIANNNNLFESNKNRNGNNNNKFFAFNKNKINNILQNQNINNSENVYTNDSGNAVNNYNQDSPTVNRKLEFDNSEKIQFLDGNTNEREIIIDDNYSKGKDSIFDVYKSENKYEIKNFDKGEIRLSNLEIDDDSHPKNLNVNIFNKDVEIDEEEIKNLNEEVMQKQREFIKSASNFQIKYNLAFDTKLNQSNILEQNRNSYNDYFPFMIDENLGFTLKDKDSIRSVNADENSINKKYDDKLNSGNISSNKKENSNNSDKKIIFELNENKNNIINKQIENFSSYKDKESYLNKHNFDFSIAVSNSKLINLNKNNDDESSLFYNNTRRPTCISNTQGIINEISRVSSFNFDKDIPNQYDWETNDIINNDETVMGGDETKFVFNFSGKTKKEDSEQVNQIIDDIDEFNINENNEDNQTNPPNTNNIQIDSLYPFSYESSNALKNLYANNNNNNIFDIKNISTDKNNLNTSKHSNMNLKITSNDVKNNSSPIIIEEREPKKYNLFDSNINKNSKSNNDTNDLNKMTKMKKQDYSAKLNTNIDVAEKILEEEDNEEDDIEKKDKVQPIEKFSINSLKNNNTNTLSSSNPTGKPTHNRNATMDLDKEFTKPSEYMCYDFLTLRRNVAIINMLDKYNEGVSSYEMFSENVHYFDDQKKKTKRYLFITCIRNYDFFLKSYIF